MSIMVCVKRVIDPYARVRLTADGAAIHTEGVKMSMNPFDEIALEAAIRLKEAGHIEEITVVTVGSAVCEDILRTALAMGATHAMRIQSAVTEPLQIATVLAAVYQRLQPRMVLCGKQAIDNDCNQVGQMLAALCALPQATFASDIQWHQTHIHVTRETDAGLETLELPLPAVVTTDLRLNTPRYAALPAILKARKAPIEVFNDTDMTDVPAAAIQLKGYHEPAPRAAGQKVFSAEELVHALQQRGVL